MTTKFFTLLLALFASVGLYAGSFVGFDGSDGSLSTQIANGLVTNKNNITLEKDYLGNSQYTLNLANAGTGTFKMGGVTFSFTYPEAGKIAYKTYLKYIQPNGVDREITIPTVIGERVVINLVESCSGILVNGVSKNFNAGDNIITATGSSIVLRNPTTKPKISAITSLGTTEPTYYTITFINWDGSRLQQTEVLEGDMPRYSGATPTRVEDDDYTYTFTGWTPQIVVATADATYRATYTSTPKVHDGDKVHVGSFYYLLNVSSRKAVLTYQYANSINNYSRLATAIIPSVITYNNVSYSVVSIGDSAFYKSTSLNSLFIPYSVTNIGTHAISYCSNLTSIDVATDNKDYCSIDGVLLNNNKTTLIQYPIGKNNTIYNIPNNILRIESFAFVNCKNLRYMIIGASVKTIGESIFEGCSNIESLTCYGQYPPNVENNALKLSNQTVIYVPAELLNAYRKHDAWKNYIVNQLGTQSLDVVDVQVSPADNYADICWPVVNGAVSYELEIKDMQGSTICIYGFNAQGHVIALAFRAPAVNGNRMPEQTQQAGFSFTITGLESGTTYDYTLTTKDSGGNVLDTKTGIFTTNGETGLEEIHGVQMSSSVQPKKVLIDGNVYIVLPDGRVFNPQGAEVK